MGHEAGLPFDATTAVWHEILIIVATLIEMAAIRKRWGTANDNEDPFAVLEITYLPILHVAEPQSPAR